MYKLIPIFLFAFGIAETVEVYYTTDTPIAGIQFNVDGVTVTKASGGHAAANGFMISSSATTVLGFSLEGTIIPAGEGVLVVLEIDGNTADACLSGIIISDSDGDAVDATVEDCTTIVEEGDSDNTTERFDDLIEQVIDFPNFECIDDDAALTPYDCSEVVAMYGCDFTWENSTIGELCPISCDACPKPSDDMKNVFYNTSWAVIIGINKYENIKPLRFAVQDAREIRNLLITKFSFPKENIKFLLNEDATLENIKYDLYEIASMADYNDRILVYFAGHGQTHSLKNGIDKGYLIPTDGNLDKIYTTCLPMTEIKEVANITVAKHVLFLMDACFSGLAAVDTRGLDRSTHGYIEKIVRDQARQIITAGGKKDEVIEKDEWGHSAFAKNLIQGLKNAVADLDYNGYITADELGSFLQKRVYIDSENQQMPLKARFGSGEGEFVFLARKIIENVIKGIVPNVFEKDRTSSLRADLLTNDEIRLLYGKNEIVKELLNRIREIEQFTSGYNFIYGCTDESAINYNPSANWNDESCIFLDSDDFFIRFGDFHNNDSTLDVFMTSNRRIYNLEIFTDGFEIVDVVNGNLDLDNVKTSFDLEEIYVEFSDSLDGYIIPEKETLVFKAKIIPIDEAFCFTGLTINDNEHDTINVILGDCKTGLSTQQLALLKTMEEQEEVEILEGSHAGEMGTIIKEKDEGTYDILLQDSTLVEDVDPSEVNRFNKQIYSRNHIWIKNVDYVTNTMDLGVHAIDDLAGFQLDIEGVTIDAVYGGAATLADFTISSSTTSMLGFSMEGDVVQAGEYTLVKVDFSTLSKEWKKICLERVIFAGYQGDALDVIVGDCWIY